MVPFTTMIEYFQDLLNFIESQLVFFKSISISTHVLKKQVSKRNIFPLFCLSWNSGLLNSHASSQQLWFYPQPHWHLYMILQCFWSWICSILSKVNTIKETLRQSCLKQLYRKFLRKKILTLFQWSLNL